MVAVLACGLFAVIGLLILLKRRYTEFVVYWILTASAADSCGLVSYIQDNTGFYSVIMGIELVLCAALSLNRYLKSTNKKYFGWVVLSISFVPWITLSFFSSGLYDMGVHRIIYHLAQWCPMIVQIILTDNHRYVERGGDLKNLFSFFVCFQCIVAFLITYLPLIGIDVFDIFCGANYVSDGWIYNRTVFNLSGIKNTLGNKFFYNGLGQFHNANDMGFYGVMCAYVAGYELLTKKNVRTLLFSGLLLVIAIHLWGNSGMRGPVIGLGIGVFLSILFLKKRLKIVWIVAVIIIGIALLYSEIGNEIMVYLVPEQGNISYTSRAVLRLNGIRYISENPIFGAGGRLSDLTAESIDPHELPLRYACLFGIPAGLLVLYFYTIRPAGRIIRSKKRPIPIILYCILMLVAFTNNFTDYGLFEFAFALCIVESNKDSIPLNFIGEFDEKNSIIYR